MTEIGSEWVEFAGVWWVRVYYGGRKEDGDLYASPAIAIRPSKNPGDPIPEGDYSKVYRHWSKVDVTRIDPGNPPPQLRFEGREYARVRDGEPILDGDIAAKDRDITGSERGRLVASVEGRTVGYDENVFTELIYRETQVASIEVPPGEYNHTTDNQWPLGGQSEVENQRARLAELEAENERLKRHLRNWEDVYSVKEAGPSAAASAKPVTPKNTVGFMGDWTDDQENL